MEIIKLGLITLLLLSNVFSQELDGDTRRDVVGGKTLYPPNVSYYRSLSQNQLQVGPKTISFFPFYMEAQMAKHGSDPGHAGENQQEVKTRKERFWYRLRLLYELNQTGANENFYFLPNRENTDGKETCLI